MNRPSRTKVFGVIGGIAGVVLAGYGITWFMNGGPYGWELEYVHVTPHRSHVAVFLDSHSLFLVSGCFLAALAICYLVLRRNSPRT